MAGEEDLGEGAATEAAALARLEFELVDAAEAVVLESSVHRRFVGRFWSFF